VVFCSCWANSTTIFQMIWPSASRAYDLLNGVKIQFDNAWTHLDPSSDHRRKRPADDAFGREKSSDLLQREAFGVLADKDMPSSDGNGVQDISTRIMAHMLGLDIPGIEPSTSYLPGYEWWPRHNGNEHAPPPRPTPPMGSSSPSSGGYDGQPDWYRTSADPHPVYAFDMSSI
jgi:hypothetical protein